MDHYGTEAKFKAWAEARAVEVPTGAVVPVLVRGSAYLDAVYGARFIGSKADGFDQGLEWPRVGAVTASGHVVPSDIVPAAVERATYEAAIRELREPGSTLPDVDPSTVVKRERVGPIDTEYAVPTDGSTSRPIFGAVDGLLAAFLRPVATAGFLLKAIGR